MGSASDGFLTAGGIVIHVCSGPWRPGAYSEYLKAMNIRCFDIDFIINKKFNLCLNSFWDGLLKDTIDGVYDGMQADPQCSTFSVLRSRAGGPAPLRDAQGPGRYGRKLLSDDQKKQVQLDNLLATRVAALAKIFYDMNRPLS